MLKLNVGFNRKVGEAHYGSRGASVNLELELDSTLVADGDRLKDRIRQMFLLAKASVDEKLEEGRPNPGANSNGANGNGHSNGNGRHPDASQRKSSGRRATVSQVRAIHAIADGQGVDLDDLLRDRYGVGQAEDLTISQASALIDELKSQTNGNGSGGRR